jgi:hypothetical protein
MVMLLVWLCCSTAAAQNASCPAGQNISEDTAGHCCWSGQAWSRSREKCVGIPACPNGFTPGAETCKAVCPEGQQISEETFGHCCWPAQVWSKNRQACVGVPSCPRGFEAQGEACGYAATLAPLPIVSPQAPPAPPEAAPTTEPTPTPPPPPPPAGTVQPPPVPVQQQVQQQGVVPASEPIFGDGSEGENAPRGKTHATKGLVTGGVVVSTVFYGLTIFGTLMGELVCSNSNSSPVTCHVGEGLGYSLIPIAGPWLSITEANSYWSPHWRNPGAVSAAVGCFVVAGLAQAAGLVLTVTGILVRKPDVPEAPRKGRKRASLELQDFGDTWWVGVGSSPTAQGQGGTLAFGMRFF